MGAARGLSGKGGNGLGLAAKNTTTTYGELKGCLALFGFLEHKVGFSHKEDELFLTLGRNDKLLMIEKTFLFH